MINRIYIEKLQKMLTMFPVVAVIGARQIGKTTLCRELISEKRKYFNLDDTATLHLAEKEPGAILDTEGHIIIDEIQRAPGLMLEIKKRVDSEKVYGKYLLTGSANIELLPKLQETLAGRIAFIEIFPVTEYENRGDFSSPPGIIRLLEGESPESVCSGKVKFSNATESILYGSYPEPLLKRDSFYSDIWFDGYVRAYLERDVRSLSNIQSLGEYQRVLSLSALRIGSLVSLSDLSRDCGIPLMTLKRYLNLLYISYQYHLLPPFYRNIGKRLVKAPKLYSYDGGLSAWLLGIRSVADANRLNKTGALFENKIVTEIKALLSTYMQQVKLSFFRSHGGGEIDLILEQPGRLIPVEIKSTEAMKKINTVTIQNFMQEFKDETEFAIILAQTDEVMEVSSNIFIVPWQRLLT